MERLQAFSHSEGIGHFGEGFPCRVGSYRQVLSLQGLPDPKEPYRNDWHDEDGDDEYNAQMFYEAYEITADFLMTADSPEEMVLSLRTFFDYIRNGEFKIFDTYTGIGRQKVRYAGYSESAYKWREGRICYAQFSLRFKVNDPVTFIHNNSGVLEEVTDEE